MTKHLFYCMFLALVCTAGSFKCPHDYIGWSPLCRRDVSCRNGDIEAADPLAGQLLGQLGGTSIFLVGMMGSGKTTVGKLLAQRLGYLHLDSDEAAECLLSPRTIAEVFEEVSGEETFRQLETAVLQELAPHRRVVVSTGGGAVLRRENWG
ncbi:hypothetical protein EON64_15005, partial [archaeon]